MLCSVFARIYCTPGYIDQEDQHGNILPGDWRIEGSELHSISQAGSNMYFKSLQRFKTVSFPISTHLLEWYHGEKINST